MNSQNSSKSPSTDGFTKPSGKKPGAQKCHKGNGFKLMKNPDETIKYYPVACEAY